MSRTARLIAAGVLGGGVNPYLAKLAAIAPANLIGWWRMAEPSGSVSVDSSGQANNGAYTGVTLNQTGIGDGLTAASFDGTTSFNNIYSAALASDFSPLEGTLACWVKVSAVGVWTDATDRRIMSLSADANNEVSLLRQSTNGQVWGVYKGTSTLDFVAVASGSPTGWFHLAMTYSVTGDALKVYFNGAQSGATQTTLGTWAGALASTRACVGSQTLTPGQVFSGALAHAMVWNTPLSATQILQLATVP